MDRLSVDVLELVVLVIWSSYDIPVQAIVLWMEVSGLVVLKLFLYLIVWCWN
jgi:hypothetical protein